MYNPVSRKDLRLTDIEPARELERRARVALFLERLERETPVDYDRPEIEGLWDEVGDSREPVLKGG